MPAIERKRLLFAIRRRLVSKLTLLVMAVMTLITLWIVFDDPVKDCGCFGDAIVLSNMETFIKNIILLGLEGGGMPPEQAQAMFDRYVDGQPLYQKDNPSSPARVAAQVMEAAWFGVAEVLEQPSGKDEAGDPQPADPTEQ